jgi:hypothetical protein
MMKERKRRWLKISKAAIDSLEQKRCSEIQSPSAAGVLLGEKL